MNYTENYQGIKVDVQAVDINIHDDVQQEVRNAIDKLQRHATKINWVDVYFNVEANQPTNNKSVSIRVGIPGPDVFASDTGEHWLPLLKSVEEKLRRQLQKK